MEIRCPRRQKSSMRTGKNLELLSQLSSMRNGTLGKITTLKHHIDLEPDPRAAFRRSYRAGSKPVKHEARDTDWMLTRSVIESAMSESASPVVLARKKDGKLRFCVDQKHLRTMNVRHTYQLSRMHDCTAYLWDAKIFSTVSCSTERYQIEKLQADPAYSATIGYFDFSGFRSDWETPRYRTKKRWIS